MNEAVPEAHDVLLDVAVGLSLEVGRVKMTIRDFLQMAPGAVVKLERPVGDPLDVYVNGRLVAHGEVVMVNEKYGVRFTEAVGTSGIRG